MSTPLTGSLEERSLPAVLRPLVRARRTGVLRFRRGKVQKTVYLSEGRLIFATSTDPDDRLGEMLLRKGLVSYRGFEDSVRAIQLGKRQGTILVESGAIRSRDLVEGVSEQVREIIYGLFGWEDGSYEFVEGPLPSREVIVLRMSTADLLREGIRRIAGWNRIRAGVGGLEQLYALSPDSAAVMSGMSLQKEDLSVVRPSTARRPSRSSARRFAGTISWSAVPYGACGRPGSWTGCRRTATRQRPCGRRRSPTRNACGELPWDARSTASTSFTAFSSSS